jgi:hypothetical protein
MDMSISQERLISQLEPFEKPCFVVVGQVEKHNFQHLHVLIGIAHSSLNSYFNYLCIWSILNCNTNSLMYASRLQNPHEFH